MNILFLDQTGQPGGAELCLLDIAKPYRDRCLVGLFSDGQFRVQLEQQQIPVQVLTQRSIQVRKESHWWTGLASLNQVIPLAIKVAQLSANFDVIYANTQKALVVGAIASALSGRPLIYHLHDILNEDHFSRTNQKLAVALANRFAVSVIAVSHTARNAFIAAGGSPDRVEVIYNGFDPARYECDRTEVERWQQQLGLDRSFVVGHFSRFSPWKGQHVLLEALHHCPDAIALLVGDALFGEAQYAEFLRDQVREQGLQDRVRFVGFQTNIVPLMHLCDVMTHTSTAPEPFGRILIEAALCGRPLITTQSSSSLELMEAGLQCQTVLPGNPLELAKAIQFCQQNLEQVKTEAAQAQQQIASKFHVDRLHQNIAHLLRSIESNHLSNGNVTQTVTSLRR